MSGEALGVDFKRSEFMVMKRGLPSISIEMLVQQDLVKITARDKSL